MLTYRNFKRVMIALVGGTVLLLGLALLVLPGPGIPVVIGGLAILAVEFAWARHWLHKTRDFVTRRTWRSATPPAQQPAADQVKSDV